MRHTDRAIIDDFLAQRRLAVIGVSQQKNDFTRMLYREFLQREYDAVPVHPSAAEIEGRPAFPRIADVKPGVDAALVLVPGGKAVEVVRECIEAGVKRIWLYRAVTAGALSSEAVDLCDRHGVAVVAGECPFMFLPNSGAIHAVHSFFRRLTGSYPG
jgi:predicted CoA-binding protein